MLNILPATVASAVSGRQERRLVYRMVCVSAEKNEAD
jgi:hypothetical protein